MNLQAGISPFLQRQQDQRHSDDTPRAVLRRGGELLHFCAGRSKHKLPSATLCFLLQQGEHPTAMARRATGLERLKLNIAVAEVCSALFGAAAGSALSTTKRPVNDWTAVRTLPFFHRIIIANNYSSVFQPTYNQIFRLNNEVDRTS